LLLILIVLSVVGAAWQFFARRADLAQYPPLVKLVTVEGHAMHIYCTGTGSPTVVLEGSVPEWSIHW
jgi:hypothetical protein